MKNISIAVAVLCIFVGSYEAQAGRGGGKKTQEPFVDGFNDQITPGLLCPWEQLNRCEGRKEVFVLGETRRANGTVYHYDYDLAQLEHIDVCMNERDAPTGRILYELTPLPINLEGENGCYSPCNMLLRTQYLNHLSCHENIALDQSQALLLYYSMDTIWANTRADRFFCHEDHLPPNVTAAECLASTSDYCYRRLEAGETGYEYEDYLDECLSTDWFE